MDSVQLIVECISEIDEELLAEIGVIKYKLPMIGACVLEVSTDSVRYLRRQKNIKAIYETSNITTQSFMPGKLTGKGVNIAILDTGLCPVADFTKPINRLIAFKDFVNGRNDFYDDNGHGTHV